MLLASPALAAPARVASLGLCTDELVLLLARPGQLVSVSFLAHDPLEMPLAARAEELHANDGTLGSVIALKPDLVMTGGAVNRFARELAARTGTRVVDVPPPTDIAGLRANVRRVAAALGEARRGETLLKRFDAALGAPPRRPRAGAMIAAGGLTPGPDSLTADLLRHAGYATPFRGGRVTLEALAARPGLQVIMGDYRSRQYSLPQAWLRTATRVGRRPPISVDGRLWTCPGPLAVQDVARLRAALR